MSDLITVSAAAEQKGCSRKTVRAALDRDELHGVRGAKGWAGVHADGAFQRWEVPSVGRPLDPGAKPESVMKRRYRGKATGTNGTAVEASRVAAAGRSASGPGERAPNGSAGCQAVSDAEFDRVVEQVMTENTELLRRLAQGPTGGTPTGKPSAEEG